MLEALQHIVSAGLFNVEEASQHIDSAWPFNVEEASAKDQGAAVNNENQKDLVKDFIDSLILDPTEAKTHPTWCWLPANAEGFGKETCQSFTRTCVEFHTNTDQEVINFK